MKTSGIYSITLRSDGRRYVGQSVDIANRWRQHRSDLNRGGHRSPHLQHTWTKYGPDSFEFSILEECPPRLLTEREQHWMDLLQPEFNIAPAAGSQLGYRHTDAAKRKIGSAVSGEKNGFFGKNHSPETLAQLRGRTVSEQTRERMREAWKTREPDSPETRARKSAAKMGNPSHSGRTLSEQHKANLSAALTGRVVSGETRKKLSDALTGHSVSEETRRRISTAKRGKPSYERTPEIRAKMSEAARAWRAERRKTEQ